MPQIRLFEIEAKRAPTAEWAGTPAWLHAGEEAEVGWLYYAGKQASRAMLFTLAYPLACFSVSATPAAPRWPAAAR